MVRKFKRYGSSSSAPIEHSSEIEPEVTGTFGVHIELCPASPDNDVSVLLWIEHSSMIIFIFLKDFRYFAFDKITEILLKKLVFTLAHTGTVLQVNSYLITLMSEH